MPDDVKVDDKPVVVAEPVEPKVEDKPHPLEPGGERFKEVYADMMEARRATARLEGEVAALREAQRVQPKQPQIYTPQQLQSMVDEGRITQATMADQLAWQRAQEAREQGRQEAVAQQRNSSALTEVREYIDRIPALENTTSPEFNKVKRVAGDIAEEMGLDIRDPRVQRRALREVYGTLDRVKATNNAVEHDRERSTRFSDTGGGGGGSVDAKPDPLKKVPKAYLEHWQRLGYSHEQMAEEAKFVSREPRKGDGRR